MVGGRNQFLLAMTEENKQWQLLAAAELEPCTVTSHQTKGDTCITNQENWETVFKCNNIIVSHKSCSIKNHKV